MSESFITAGCLKNELDVNLKGTPGPMERNTLKVKGLDPWSGRVLLKVEALNIADTEGSN